MKIMRDLLCVLLLTVPGVPGAASAPDNYPSRPIRWIIPYAAGGPVDVVARPVAQKLTESWGQPAVLDSRPGASTMIGTEMVVRSPPDGYTLLLTSAGHAIIPTVHDRMPYDTAKDLTPISLFVAGPFLLGVHPSVRAATVRELIATARSRPGQVTFASAGSGSLNHMAGELFKVLAKIDIVHVPYKGGAPATIDLVGGHVAIMFHSLVGFLPYMKTGRVRALAVTSPQRFAQLPEVPTMIESGVAGFEVETWYGALGPAALPRSIVDKLSREFDRILKLPEMRERWHAQGLAAVGGAPEQFGARIAADLAKWGPVAKASGARAN
jgi:tripartite-type tricarboxylate transporter receptor subunit TctC